jgi:hypothetical protein
MNDKITLENFSSTNRTRFIGNSLYRICRADDEVGNWYIHETYNSGGTFAGRNAYYSSDLTSVIERLNSFTKEREVIDLEL